MKKEKKKTVQKEVKTEMKDWRNWLIWLEEKLVEISKKLPTLPLSASEFLVKYGPYFVIVGLVFEVLVVLSLFGLMRFALPYAYLGGHRLSLSVLVGFISTVLQAMAVSGLLKREKKGWNFMFYASLITALSSLLSGNLGNFILGSVINWYFLFQIRKSYK